MSLIPLKFTLKAYQSEKGIKNKIQASMICEYAKTLLLHEFGKSIEKFIKNITLAKGSLRVSSDSSNFKQAISMRELDLIKNINDKFGEKIVKNIIFKS